MHRQQCYFFYNIFINENKMIFFHWTLKLGLNMNYILFYYLSFRSKSLLLRNSCQILSSTYTGTGGRLIGALCEIENYRPLLKKN